MPDLEETEQSTEMPPPLDESDDLDDLMTPDGKIKGSPASEENE